MADLSLNLCRLRCEELADVSIHHSRLSAQFETIPHRFSLTTQVYTSGYRWPTSQPTKLHSKNDVGQRNKDVWFNDAFSIMENKNHRSPRAVASSS
jgi:hypothetical protein